MKCGLELPNCSRCLRNKGQCEDDYFPPGLLSDQTRESLDAWISYESPEKGTTQLNVCNGKDVQHYLSFDADHLYLNALLRRLHGPATTLANPKTWQVLLAATQDRMLHHAAKACGALEVHHYVHALRHHQQCLRCLQLALKSVEQKFCIAESTRICVTILILANLELMKRSIDVNLNAHIQGLTFILKQHAAYYAIHGKPLGQRYMSAQPDTAGQVYQAFRSIECIQAIRRKRASLLTYQEYEALLNINDCNCDDEKDAIYLWRLLHNCASSFGLSNKGKMQMLIELHAQSQCFSWSRMKTEETLAPEGVPFAYSEYIGGTIAQTNRRTSIKCLAEASIMRVALTIDNLDELVIKELVKQAKSISAKLLFMIHTQSCNYNWMLLIISTLQEAYTLLFFQSSFTV